MFLFIKIFRSNNYSSIREECKGAIHEELHSEDNQPHARGSPDQSGPDGTLARYAAPQGIRSDARGGWHCLCHRGLTARDLELELDQGELLPETANH